MSALPRDLLSDIVLTKDERSSALWQSLKMRFEKKLQDLRKQNDSANLTEAETARLRGHIQCIKALLALDADPPPRQAPMVPNVTAARQVLG